MKLSIEKLREIAEDLNMLADFKGGKFPLVIGGGAPRDAFLVGDVKDIDVFCDTRKVDESAWEKFIGDVAAHFDADGGPATDVSIDGPVTYDLVSEKLPTISLIPVNRCVFDDVHDYDFGICQVLVTPGGVLRTERFDSDLANNVITYLHRSPDPGQLKRSKARLQRILRKHPSLSMFNCETLCSP
ncbi:hypothetical protein [Rhizobacter sp. Root1221]|uniref:hypothetical protein n=1 Tax=Rhizobacter sp. Root1221 TaxID=1736433 RepID=UPI0006F9DA4E|nr:hypothetical protein [Rhizobacter sp. Root1221]KQV99977.1 hypothetical protein ASC87_19955 [Rhizobacter sp. Root1221]